MILQKSQIFFCILHLIGNYAVNGNILNATDFSGGGVWRLGLHLTCTMEAKLKYLNASHVGLQDYTEGDEVEMSCEKKREGG